MRFRRALAVAALAGLCLAAAACSGIATPRTAAIPTPVPSRQLVAHASVAVVPRQGEKPPPTIEQIVLSPQEDTVAPGERTIFTAVTLDSFGKPVAHGALRWQVVPAEAGTIDNNGVFTAGTTVGMFEGAITVEAASAGRIVRASSSVEIADAEHVGAGSLETLVVYPPAIKTRPGQVIGLGAVGWDSKSRFVPNLDLRWKLLVPAAGQVDNLGFFTAADTPGSYPDAIELTAIQETPAGIVRQRATVSVNIMETLRSGVLDQVVVVPRQVLAKPGQPLTFVARGFDQTGQRLDNLDFEWEVAEPDAGKLPRPGSFIAGDKTGTYPQAIVVVGRQKTPQGLVQATATATVTVTVMDDKGSDSAGILSTAQVIPGVVTLHPGERFVFTARGLGPRGTAVAARVVWTMQDARAGSMEASGVFKASRAPGIYKDALTLELTQERGGQPPIVVVAHATVNIIGPLERVEVAPAGATLEVGQAIRFVVRGFDAVGLEVSPLTAQWKIEVPGAGTIDHSGLFTAGANPGTFDNVVTAVVWEANTG